MHILCNEISKLAEEFEVEDDFMFLAMPMHVEEIDLTDSFNVVMTCTTMDVANENPETIVLTVPKKARMTILRK